MFIMRYVYHATLLDDRSLSWTGISILMLLLASVMPLMAADAESASWRDSQDPVAKLWQRLEVGEVKLDTSTERSFSKDLLKKLDVPVESQVLVFSKTSLQKSKIDPHQPRAIYYNEDCYVGWVQGGDLEIAASDPNDEMQYYLIHRKTQNTPLPSLIKSNQPSRIAAAVAMYPPELIRKIPGVKPPLSFPIEQAADVSPLLHVGPGTPPSA